MKHIVICSPGGINYGKRSIEMKVIRHITIGLLAIGMVLSLAACGGSDDTEQTVVMRYEDSVDGFSMTDTVTLTALGDTLQNEKGVIEFDISSLDDQEKAELVATMHSEYAGYYGDSDVATLDDNITNTTYTINYSVDFTGDWNSLVESGVIDMETYESNDNYVSLEKTIQSLQVEGYKPVE